MEVRSDPSEEEVARMLKRHPVRFEEIVDPSDLDESFVAHMPWLMIEVTDPEYGKSGQTRQAKFEGGLHWNRRAHIRHVIAVEAS